MGRTSSAFPGDRVASPAGRYEFFASKKKGRGKKKERREGKVQGETRTTSYDERKRAKEGETRSKTRKKGQNNGCKSELTYKTGSGNSRHCIV